MWQKFGPTSLAHLTDVTDFLTMNHHRCDRHPTQKTSQTQLIFQQRITTDRDKYYEFLLQQLFHVSHFKLIGITLIASLFCFRIQQLTYQLIHFEIYLQRFKITLIHSKKSLMKNVGLNNTFRQLKYYNMLSHIYF